MRPPVIWFLMERFPEQRWIGYDGGGDFLGAAVAGALVVPLMFLGRLGRRLLVWGNAAAVLVTGAHVAQFSVRDDVSWQIALAALVLSIASLWMPERDPRPERTRERERAAAALDLARRQSGSQR